jgi:hypothetical protein
MTSAPSEFYMFNQVELDTNVLTPQVILVARVQAAARYRGVVAEPDGSSRTFSLVVVPSPAEQSVTLDLGSSFVSDPTFTVVEKGYVVIAVNTGPGGQRIKIFNDKTMLIDNTALRADQIVVLRLLRPGKHTITDTTGGGTCSVAVTYPKLGAKLPTDKIDLSVKIVAKKTTRIDPKAATASVTQPIVIHLQDGTRITTTLDATTDRIGGRLITKAAATP